MKRAASLALVAIGTTGCATHFAALRLHTASECAAGPFAVEYDDSDTGAAVQVTTAVVHAGPELLRWGRLRELTTLRVMPSHQALEDAVDRVGYDWLRAWARYDEVFLQSPRTWNPFGTSQRDVDELVLHELTHCVMYQAAASRTSWTRKEIPLWFREGMAAVTARQGHRWASLEDLARFYEQHADEDPILRPDELYQHQSDVVYSAAYHAFDFLARRYGDEAIRSLLAAMKAGQEFPEAFAGSTGISPDAFAAEFHRYIVWRGFKARARH